MEAAQQAETKKPEKPEKKPEPLPKTRDEIKAEILALPEHKRTKKQKDKLAALVAEKKAEEHRGALVHKLVERADKWGRREIRKVRRAVTDEVSIFSKEEAGEVRAESESYAAKLRNSKKGAAAEMQMIQVRLNDDLALLTQDHNEAAEAIRGQFRERYRRAEDDIDFRAEEIALTVGYFTEFLADLTAEQLEELHKEGTLQVGEECVAVPDMDP